MDFFSPSVFQAEKGRELRVKMLTRWWYNFSIFYISHMGGCWSCHPQPSDVSTLLKALILQMEQLNGA